MLSKVTLQVPLAWLGALPEAVVRARKEGASDDDVIRFKIILKVPYYFFYICAFENHTFLSFASLLGSNVDAESYEGEVCGETLANTRCYAQVGIQNANTTQSLNPVNLIHCLTYLIEPCQIHIIIYYIYPC